MLVGWWDGERSSLGCGHQHWHPHLPLWSYYGKIRGGMVRWAATPTDPLAYHPSYMHMPCQHWENSQWRKNENKGLDWAGWKFCLYEHCNRRSHWSYDNNWFDHPSKIQSLILHFWHICYAHPSCAIGASICMHVHTHTHAYAYTWHVHSIRLQHVHMHMHSYTYACGRRANVFPLSCTPPDTSPLLC